MKCFTPLLVVALAGGAGAQSARLQPYKVAPKLKNVANYADFKKKAKLLPAHETMLVKNGFAARPGQMRQLFHIYENNDYQNLPSFVTTDTVLQLYHIFFDYTLRTAEKESFLPALKKLTTGMLAGSITQWKSANDAKIKAAALKNVAFFAVADRLLGQSGAAPDEALALARRELDLISKHGGFANGAIFPYRIDYSQFVPRGHYTRSPELRRFFGAMMWYGLAPFNLRDDGKKWLPEQIRQGALLARTLRESKLDAAWQTIYEPTVFFVGAADDLSPGDSLRAWDEVFGANASLESLADDAKLLAYAAALEKRNRSKIHPDFGLLGNVPKGTPNMIKGPFSVGAQVRFMGQRYIPDSEILQRLSKPMVRVFPSGLDVMSVLGNKRATQILDAYPQIYNAGKWDAYQSTRAKLTSEFAKRPRATWSSNLYYGWLDALRILQQTPAPGYPSFMRNTAWQDKTLHTALASWAELRHDTILYGKQSVVQCGDGSPEPPFVKGYVEPNPQFYGRLLQLTLDSRRGLQSRKLLPEVLTQKFEEFENLLTFLKRVSEKELRGEKLTRDEYLEIRYLGGKLEYMTVSVVTSDTGGPATWELLSETERDMAVVADVHTGGGMALEEGVGHAMEIYVVVPIEGKLSLTRGAAFSYFEFKHPISDRLTDEKWQSLLKAGKAPAPPVWTKSFIVPGPARKIPPSELETYNSGC